MKKEYEVIHHAKIKHLNAFVINISYRNFHMHSDFELLLVLEGSGRIQIKNDNFVVYTGDMILINPNEMHEIDAQDNGLQFLILQFSRHFLNDYFPLLRNTCFTSPLMRAHFSAEDYQYLTRTITEFTIRYIESRDFYALDCLHLFTDILRALYEHLPYEILSENTYQERKKRNDRVNRISSYIDENFLYPIRLQDIADREQISATHLSHFFADNFGVTFQEYLNDKRLEQALQLAVNNDYSLAALSELSGFSDPKYLTKTFLRKFGYPFQEYKKAVRQVINQTADSPQALQYYYSLGESLEILKRLYPIMK